MVEDVISSRFVDIDKHEKRHVPFFINAERAFFVDKPYKNAIMSIKMIIAGCMSKTKIYKKRCYL